MLLEPCHSGEGQKQKYYSDSLTRTLSLSSYSEKDQLAKPVENYTELQRNI